MDELRETNLDLEFVNYLKEQKKDGRLDVEECFDFQAYKWRNTLEYRLLECWITDEREELRLNALELITISKKSTLCFTEQELKLITVFLNFNLREKFEYVPLIKKILKRLHDSYQVLKRQLDRENKFKELQSVNESITLIPEKPNIQASINAYQSFVNTIHNICLQNLYPGAINVRKKSSLQILCLMDEFLCQDLKSSLWTLDNFKTLFECLLLDTYEINKDMAFQLMKSSKLADAYFSTKEKLFELIDIGIRLGNSVRPLDSITAAYMLKISMLSKKVQEVLLKLTKFKETDCIEEKTAFYLIVLLKMNLEDPVKLSKENIVIAASKHSLYGYVFCIHNILSTINLSGIVNDECWRDIIANIVNMCFELNTAVSQIVNNSSPEGHLPMDLDSRHLNCISEEDNNPAITAQRILLCSWRTVKEISLFFGYLTYNASIYNEKTKTGLLKENQIKEIGSQLVTLLCETKHRGAFEQAHVGFQQLCNRLWHLENEHAFLKNLPKFWLQQILLAIIGLTPENSKLCATRRSAGVPFMVQALVTSEIKKKGDTKDLIFHSVIRILLKLIYLDDELNLSEVKNILISENIFKDCEKFEYLNDLDKTEKGCIKLNEITEIKTHALNILRALFRHTILGELVKNYVAEGFIAAFKSYDGKSWAERNAATLLFSSLVVRVFGVQRTKDHVNLTLHNKMSGVAFFDKFPSLQPFFLNELKAFVDSREDEIKPKIQCILLILSRLYPGNFSESGNKKSTTKDWKVNQTWQVDQFIDLVSKCGESKVWWIRELAARALVPLVTEKNILSIFCNRIHLMTSYDLSHNVLHGYSLQLLELVRSQGFAKVEVPEEEIQKLIKFTIKLLENLENSLDLACFPAATAALEIFVELSKINSSVQKDSNFISLHKKIQSHLTNDNVLKKKPGIELYEVAAINLLLAENYSNLLTDNEYFSAQSFEYLLEHKNEEVLSISWSKLIYVIQKTSDAVLYDLGFLKAIKALDKPIEDPDAQDAVYDFVYCAIQEMETSNECTEYTFSKDDEKVFMCMHIFNKLSEMLKINSFYPRGKFFMLFARAYGFLLKCNKDTELTIASKKVIYESISYYSSMDSNLECRLGISEVLPVIFVELNSKTMKNDIYFMLEWWTALLQLLYDDNVNVRSNAGRIVNKILPETKPVCETIVTNTFFAKFAASVRDVTEIAAAACFCWSMKFAAIVLEEMDDTDVFNKSYNYESFEPLHISRNCVLHLKTILLSHNVNSIVFTKQVKEWLQKQLEINDSFEFDNLGQLIIRYKEMIPDSESTLKRILDPIYPAKLIKEIAYLEIRNAVISKSG